MNTIVTAAMIVIMVTISSALSIAGMWWVTTTVYDVLC